MITLRRIREKVDAYTGSCQSGYKMGRSCSDIVFFSENVAGGCNESILGAFQGDCLSGDLFTIILAAALHQLRAILSQASQSPYVVNHPIPNPPVSESFMPLETEYADDTSFSNSRKEPLEDLYPVCKAVFGE